MADAVAEKGYVKTSVADVLSRAGVSRATFYAQFADKEDCFCASYESIAELLADVLENQTRSMEGGAADQDTDGVADLAGDDPLAKLDRILASYLQVLHDAPSFAKAFLIESYAAGPRAVEQRRKSLEGFVELVAETHRGQPGVIGTAPEQRFAVQALVGAVGSLVTNMVGSGDIEGLPGLREPIMALIRQITGGQP